MRNNRALAYPSKGFITLLDNYILPFIMITPPSFKTLKKNVIINF